MNHHDLCLEIRPLLPKSKNVAVYPVSRYMLCQNSHFFKTALSSNLVITSPESGNFIFYHDDIYKVDGGGIVKKVLEFLHFGTFFFDLDDFIDWYCLADLWQIPLLTRKLEIIMLGTALQGGPRMIDLFSRILCSDYQELLTPSILRISLPCWINNEDLVNLLGLERMEEILRSSSNNTLIQAPWKVYQLVDRIYGQLYRPCVKDAWLHRLEQVNYLAQVYFDDLPALFNEEENYKRDELELFGSDQEEQVQFLELVESLWRLVPWKYLSNNQILIAEENPNVYKRFVHYELAYRKDIKPARDKECAITVSTTDTFCECEVAKDVFDDKVDLPLNYIKLYCDMKIRLYGGASGGERGEEMEEMPAHKIIMARYFSCIDDDDFDGVLVIKEPRHPFPKTNTILGSFLKLLYSTDANTLDSFEKRDLIYLRRLCHKYGFEKQTAVIDQYLSTCVEYVWFFLKIMACQGLDIFDEIPKAFPYCALSIPLGCFLAQKNDPLKYRQLMVKLLESQYVGPTTRCIASENLLALWFNMGVEDFYLLPNEVLKLEVEAMVHQQQVHCDQCM